eukprot:gnl/MRDRNA2_/MRDRNA2_69626_c0_seq1.p1 gnl/MRDRNA2_/MRDRNA2_69626_c0~~gnl/MRDRNA2_/MRDRNA2_69626_c0_seq1.p1  ORF type:complete len:269 (+),score=50.32 gnl/MRDRNA2_/MRDRNA2_69626_c0_seq1:282-1088(+)
MSWVSQKGGMDFKGQSFANSDNRLKRMFAFLQNIDTNGNVVSVPTDFGLSFTDVDITHGVELLTLIQAYLKSGLEGEFLKNLATAISTQIPKLAPLARGNAMISMPSNSGASCDTCNGARVEERSFLELLLQAGDKLDPKQFDLLSNLDMVENAKVRMVSAQLKQSETKSGNDDVKLIGDDAETYGIEESLKDVCEDEAKSKDETKSKKSRIKTLTEDCVKDTRAMMALETIVLKFMEQAEKGLHEEYDKKTLSTTLKNRQAELSPSM